MQTRFDDYDRTLASINQMRRRMDRMFEDFERAGGGQDVERLWSGRFPRLSLRETGTSLVLVADLPGLSEKDIQLTIHQDVLTLSGERKEDAPPGYYVHRNERAPVKFSRSLALPCKVDPENTTATVKNGVLTITLAKAMDAQPRQIAVKAQ